LESKNFVRVRIGIAPVATDGSLKKPRGKHAVEDFVLGDFTAAERTIIDKVSCNVVVVLETILKRGYAAAMNRFN